MKKTQSRASRAVKFESKVLELKEQVQTGSDFSKIFNFFFDYLGEEDEFNNICKKAKNPALKKFLGILGERLFQKKITLTHFMLLKFPKHKFYHGSFFIEGKIGGVIFFEDIDMGIFSVVKDYPETSFMRFSAVKLGASANFPAVQSKAIH